MRAEDILPDSQNQIERNGILIRKGSVGAFLASARIWCAPDTAPAQRKAAERDILEVLPGLRALGLFEVFSVRNAELQRLIDTH